MPALLLKDSHGKDGKIDGGRAKTNGSWHEDLLLLAWFFNLKHQWSDTCLCDLDNRALTFS